MYHKAVFLVALLLAGGAYAESITHGSTTINMDFVSIGHVGNSPDTRGYGAVDYNYRIGKYEVTADQWALVLASTSNLGNSGSWNGVQPVASITWYDAARYCNWLTTGDVYSGVYQFNGSGVLIGLDRSYRNGENLAYVLPSEDEWHKAAYLKSDGSGYTLYATGDTVPVVATEANYGNVIGRPWDVGSGIIENNGTFDMTGNVREWIESAYDGTLDNMMEDRVTRGGGYYWSELLLRSTFRDAGEPSGVGDNLGFRVVAIPEPSSALLLVVGSGGLIFYRRAKERKKTQIPSRRHFK